LLIATDCAELLASTATVVGPERAVAAALAVVSPETLALAAARLRPWALSGATRSACKRDQRLLPALRTELATATTDSTLHRSPTPGRTRRSHQAGCARRHRRVRLRRARQRATAPTARHRAVPSRSRPQSPQPR